MSYKFTNPDYELIIPCREARYITDLNGSSVALVPYALSDDEECFFESEVHIGGTRQIDETKEASGCDWENLISDRTNLSMFASPNDSKSLKDPSQRSLEPGTSFCYYLTNDLPNAGAVEVVGLSQLYKADNASSQQQDGGDAKEIVKDQDNLESLSNCVTRDAREVKNDEVSTEAHYLFSHSLTLFPIALMSDNLYACGCS